VLYLPDNRCVDFLHLDQSDVLLAPPTVSHLTGLCTSGTMVVRSIARYLSMSLNASSLSSGKRIASIPVVKLSSEHDCFLSRSLLLSVSHV